MSKIAFLEPLGVPGEQLKEIMAEYLPADVEAVYYDAAPADNAELIARCSGAQIVVLSQLPFRAEVMEQCPDLKYVNVAFTGTDHVDVAYCRAHGIVVSNCAGYSNSAVADLVFGGVIALARNILACDKAVREGGTKAGLIGFELEGKTFGIIGCGAIGSRVAQIANAFGCRVIAYQRHPKDVPGVEFLSMDEVLSQSDIVSIHTPLNDSTRGLIGAQELAKMKKSAFLINAARGPIVDSQALADALTNGVIAGAFVDVFETEPPIAADHPLLGAPNCLLTPHVAFASEQAFVKRAHIFGENIRTYLAGTPQNVVS